MSILPKLIVAIVQTLKSGTPIRFSLTAISDYVLKLLESHIKQVRIWNIESLLLLTNDNKRANRGLQKVNTYLENPGIRSSSYNKLNQLNY